MVSKVSEFLFYNHFTAEANHIFNIKFQSAILPVDRMQEEKWWFEGVPWLNLHKKIPYLPFWATNGQFIELLAINNDIHWFNLLLSIPAMWECCNIFHKLCNNHLGFNTQLCHVLQFCNINKFHTEKFDSANFPSAMNELSVNAWIVFSHN